MSHFKPYKLTQKGFSILEVLVATGLMAIISLGLVTMFQNMAIEQKRINLFNTLRELKSRMEFVVRDQNAWVKTINDTSNPSLSCLINSTICTVQDPATGSPTKIVLSDAAGNRVFDLLDWTGAGASGFTENGTPCTTFSSAAGAGVDSCPISYRLVYLMFCTNGATTCSNPQIKVTGRLIFNPHPQGILNRFRNLIAVGNLSQTGTSGADEDTDDAKYDIAIKRTSAQLNRYFKIVMTADGNTPCDSGSGTDRKCNDGPTYLQHPGIWNTHPALVDNTYGLVDITSADGKFKFTEIGYYSCTISVTAFATLGFRANIYNESLNKTVSEATAVAGEWTTASAVIDAKFYVQDITHVYYIGQRCDSLPSGRTPSPPINVDNCTLGMNTSPYNPSPNGTTIVSMSCYRMDLTF